MLPIVQFDPASLALCYDAELIGGSGLDPRSKALVDAVANGETEKFEAAVRDLRGSPDLGRALQVSSAFIHEKRHFLDFISTNYGAYRFRQFLELYGNIPTILSRAAGRTLHAPFEVYADPAKCLLMGIEEVAPEFLEVALSMKRRREMIQKDRSRHLSRFGSFELGGEAQLEALAYHAQFRFLSKYAGKEGLAAFFQTIFNREQFNRKYNGIGQISRLVGLVPSEELDPKSVGLDDGTVLNMDMGLLECVLFASLQSDHVQRDLAETHHVASSYPADRFAGLAVHLMQERPDLCGASVGSLDLEECWSAVSDACEAVFGLSPVRQVEEDLAWAEHFREKIAETGQDLLLTIFDDYHKLRHECLKIMRSRPWQLYSTEVFALSGGSIVHPLRVVCASSGVIGEPPEGHSRIMGYDESGGDDSLGYRKWWWACVVDEPLDGALQVGNPSAWRAVMDSMAPIAKLLMNGRRIRNMLGPEILFAEQQIKARLNIDMKFHPKFAFPDEQISCEILRYYYGRRELTCDFTNAPVPDGTGSVIAPWTMRRYPELAQRTITAMGGHEIAYYTFVRDWSPWVASDEALSDLSPLMSDATNS